MNAETQEITLREQPQADTALLAAINKSELDQQITTARAFPRSIAVFVKEASALVTISQEVAEECIYAIPRDNKIIRGPSARFGEVLSSRYRNCRAGSRIVAEDENFVIAQGVFHDLETNSATTYEVRRRIVNKYGQRYNADMIGVTANAACSIAMRQAVLKGIPKALWISIYAAAEQTLAGGSKPLNERRDLALAYFQKVGVEPARVYARLGVAGYEDLGPDQLLDLSGIKQAIRDAELSPETAFPPLHPGGEPEARPAGLAGLKAKLSAEPGASAAPPPPPPPDASQAATGGGDIPAPDSGEPPPPDVRPLMEDPSGNLVDVETGEIVTRAGDRDQKRKGKGK